MSDELSQRQAWLAAWRTAAPVLDELRAEELRQLDEHAGLEMLDGAGEESPYENGLVIFQRTMMAWRTKLLTDQVEALTMEVERLRRELADRSGSHHG